MYAIIGGSGFLGHYLIKEILELTPEHILATGRDIANMRDSARLKWMPCDVQKPESVSAVIDALKREDHVKIIYLAAYHHPDKVEMDPEYAWNINVTCLSAFVNQCRFVDALYYSSTDCVYGNSVDDYHFVEDDPLHPVNAYGHQKCAAEAVVIHAGFNVVRFPFLISPSCGKKSHFYDVIVDSTKKGIPFEMYDDSFRSSLSFENAARLLISVMRHDGTVPQVLNICGDRALSKYDVGILIADREGISRDLIVPISIRKQMNNFQTQRAESTLMSNQAVKDLLGLDKIDIFEPVNVR